MENYNNELKGSNISMRNILIRILSGFSYIIILLVLCVITTIVSPAFFTLGNLLNVLAQMVPFFILGAGQTLVLVTGGIDLSVGAVGGVGGLVTGYMLMNGYPILLSMIVGLAIGAGFGLINGLIITKVHINAFITTFGIRFVAIGILSWYFAGKLVYDFPEPFRFLGIGRIGNFPFVIIIGILVFVILYLLSHYTIFGRSIYSVGSNPTASKISGINTDRVIIITYIISGIAAAFAVMLFIARGNTASARVAEGLELMAIAAALLGGASFLGGIGSVKGAVLGAFILTLLGNVINLIGISMLWQRLFTGVVMILVVFGNEMIRKINERYYQTKVKFIK